MVLESRECQLVVEEVDHPMVVEVADNQEVEEQPHHNERRGGSGLGQGPDGNQTLSEDSGVFNQEACIPKVN